MKKTMLALATLLLVVAVADAKYEEPRKLTKQFGGSTGDSAVAIADSSVAVKIPNNVTSVLVTTMADTLALRKIQVSRDGETNWVTIAVDSSSLAGVPATEYRARTSADLNLWAGWYVRVILDNLSGVAKTYQTSYITWEK